MCEDGEDETAEGSAEAEGHEGHIVCEGHEDCGGGGDCGGDGDCGGHEGLEPKNNSCSPDPETNDNKLIIQAIDNC